MVALEEPFPPGKTIRLSREPSITGLSGPQFHPFPFPQDKEREIKMEMEKGNCGHHYEDDRNMAGWRLKRLY